MSGESIKKSAPAAESLDRVFGEKATCNRCGMRWPGYRVIVSFFDDVVAIRAYCPPCYDVASEGEYHAAGDGLILEAGEYAARFGAGEAPVAPTPVNRRLSSLVRDPSLRELVPGSEAAARRLRHTPYRFLVEMEIDQEPLEAVMVIEPDGRLVTIEGDPRISAHLQARLAPTA